MENEIIKKSASAKKNVVQDVIPSKRSIRDIELTSRRRPATQEIKRPQMEKPSEKVEPIAPPKINPVKPSEFTYKYEYDEPKKSSKKWLYIAVGILVIAVAFGISALFKSAKITITPRNQAYDLNANFSAVKNAGGSGLAFQIVTVSKDMEQTVPATGSQKIDTKATGQIVIMNNYSSASQKLVATTRFQTPDGLVFRINSPVTVPGKQTVAGKSVPGSVTATVTADASGDKYNIGLEDFVLPGFKGDPRYSQIYARSKTSMTGGFSGIQKVVDSGTMASTSDELESGLKASLQSDIALQIPASFVMYPDSLSYSFSSVTQATSSDNTAVLKKTGTAYAIIFDKGNLSRAVVSNLLANATTSEMIKTVNLDKLTLSYTAGQRFDPAGSGTTLNFTLSGKANLVWVFDENKLKSDVLGLSKSQALAVIQRYNAVSEVWLETNPFWNQNIPTDPTKVQFVNTLEQ